MKENDAIKFTLRFRPNKKAEAAIYKAMTDAAWNNRRSYNDEILHALKSHYKVKA